MGIHSTAIVDKGAQIAEGVEIGPYSIVGPEVKIGPGSSIMSHAVLDGNVSIGEKCVIHPFARIGGQTQDLKFKGGTPGVRVGDRTTLREYVTINAATNDGEYTLVGDDCLLMAYTHVAHGCRVGNEVVIANSCQLAGHVVVEDAVTIEGMCGIVQFRRLGRMSFVGGASKVSKDLPSYLIGVGNPLAVRGINRIGMERRGVSAEARSELKRAYRILYRKKLSVARALEEIESQSFSSKEVGGLIDFIKRSEVGIVH